MIVHGKVVRLVTVFALLALLLPACRRTPDEEQVRAAVAAMVQAVEAGLARGVGAPLSDDFDGNAGQLDRPGLVGMVRLLSLRGDHVGVVMGPLSIEPRGDRLVVSFTVTLTSGGRLLPDQLGVYQVESGWRQEDGEWRCYTASWKRSL